MVGLAGGMVWLGILGQWQVIWLGIFALFFSPYVIPILMMPAGALSHFMTLYHTANRPDKERLMFVLTLGYILLFITLWCAGIFGYVMRNVAAPEAKVAALLWANTSALVPLLQWVGKDKGNAFIVATVEMTQVAVLLLSGLSLLGVATPFWVAVAVIGGVLGLAVGVQVVYEKKFMKKSGGI